MIPRNLENDPAMSAFLNELPGQAVGKKKPADSANVNRVQSCHSNVSLSNFIYHVVDHLY
jgi:hypothetical protein